MVAHAISSGLIGINGFLVDVEADCSRGMDGFFMVGLPDNAVRESKDRILAAMKNCNLLFPQRRVTINLAPASIRKEGAAFDLPIATAILAADNQIPKPILKDYVIIGELALDGRLRKTRGVLPMLLDAHSHGLKKAIVPHKNAHEAAVAQGMEIYPAKNLYEVYNHLNGKEQIPQFTVNLADVFESDNHYGVDFDEVKGMADVRRAVEIAVSGGHNVIMIGPPGSGKSMLAKRIPTILPNLTYDEALEITKVHSIAGILPPNTPLATTRPFRNPHHTISSISLSGGGGIPKPGELSLAHNGVLFMDELPEFRRDALEVLRQPLEDGEVTISRIQGTFTYPCQTLLVASMNPCKCGWFGDSEHQCSCTPQSVERYRSKISGPLMDRIDIHIDVPPVKYDELHSHKKGESSAEIKKRVNAARKIQVERYKLDGIFCNAALTPRLISKYCSLSNECCTLLKNAFERLNLSARAHDRILKVARTIADLSGAENIQMEHLAEAIQYRSLDRAMV